MASVEITSGEQRGKYFQLQRRPLGGGRDPAMEIQLIDPKVSRRHFQIRWENDAYVVRELRSKNGVFVNGERIASEQVLQDGDEIQVGDSTLVYRADEDPDRTNAVHQFRQVSRELREDRTLTD